MTKIVELAGIGKTEQLDAVALKQRGARVKRPAPLSTNLLSEGEMLLELYRQRFKMLSEFFPEVSDFKQAATIAENALHRGLHTATGIIPTGSFFNPLMQGLGGILVKARLMTKPASRWTAWEQKARTPETATVSEIPQVDCSNMNPSNFNPPTMQEWLQGGGFGSGLPLNAQGYNQWVTQQLDQQTQAYNACQHENKWRKILNEKWMDVAHHPLYEFAENPNSLPASVATKSVLHRNAVGTISDISKINRTLIRTWQENGIIYHNMKEGAGPLTGKESVQGVYEAYQNGISGIPIAALTALIVAIAGALAEAAGLINAIKGQAGQSDAQKFEINTQGWGTPDWTAKPDDWATGAGSGPGAPDAPGTSAGFDFQKNLPLILLGAGGLILLK